MYCIYAASRSSLLIESTDSDRISVFKSIAIFVPCVTMCSFYRCIVDYPCGCANILGTLKTLLVLSMDLLAFYGLSHCC